MADQYDDIYQDEEGGYRDSLSTVTAEGKRIWVYPKKQKGKYYWYRTIVAVVLLALLFVLPFLKKAGEPLFLINILKREFILFGVPFTPQDTFLFAVLMISGLVFIVLFTVIFGRLFCGWVCPQTIFMEHVFRRIEYWIEGDAHKQKQLNKKSWSEKGGKKILKWSIFYIISFLIAITFLAYIIGIEEVFSFLMHPLGENMGGFIVLLLFSFAFFFVFANLREQVCTTICPYGRLQGVMLDKNSIVVTYDHVRGEPRGKLKKSKAKSVSTASLTSPESLVVEDTQGDCVDCNLCVRVCPTGIDIRHGTQLECINCTLCMDACDEIMEKVKKPTGLIRYDSHNGVEIGKQKIFNTRTIAYSIVLIAILGFLGFLLFSRGSIKPMIQRARGSIYIPVDEDTGKNLYNFQVINKTRKVIPIEIKLLNKKGVIEFVGDQELLTPPKGMLEGSVFISLDDDQLDGRTTPLQIGIYSEGKELEVIDTGFLGPQKD